jgi:hypothetical protein
MRSPAELPHPGGLAAHVVQRPVGAWPRGDYLVAIACASGWLGWICEWLVLAAGRCIADVPVVKRVMFCNPRRQRRPTNWPVMPLSSRAGIRKGIMSLVGTRHGEIGSRSVTLRPPQGQKMTT